LTFKHDKYIIEFKDRC